MPPKVKYRKEEIARAALDIARKKGADAVTAREVAAALGVSPRPIFTWYASMEELRGDVYELAKEEYRTYIQRGLGEEVPFPGVWQQYLRFAREEPELYRLLFLSPPDGVSGGAMEAMGYSRELVRGSLMRAYRLEEKAADSYFRDMWLVAFSYAALVVTGGCPCTDEEIFAVGAEISLALCKAFKEIPGLPEGKCDKEALFRELVQGPDVEKEERE